MPNTSFYFGLPGTSTMIKCTQVMALHSKTTPIPKSLPSCHSTNAPPQQSDPTHCTPNDITPTQTGLQIHDYLTDVKPDVSTFTTTINQRPDRPDDSLADIKPDISTFTTKDNEETKTTNTQLHIQAIFNRDTDTVHGCHPTTGTPWKHRAWDALRKTTDNVDTKDHNNKTTSATRSHVKDFDRKRQEFLMSHKRQTLVSPATSNPITKSNTKINKNTKTHIGWHTSGTQQEVPSWATPEANRMVLKRYRYSKPEVLKPFVHPAIAVPPTKRERDTINKRKTNWALQDLAITRKGKQPALPLYTKRQRPTPANLLLNEAIRTGKHVTACLDAIRARRRSSEQVRQWDKMKATALRPKKLAITLPRPDPYHGTTLLNRSRLPKPFDCPLDMINFTSPPSLVPHFSAPKERWVTTSEPITHFVDVNSPQQLIADPQFATFVQTELDTLMESTTAIKAEELDELLAPTTITHTEIEIAIHDPLDDPLHIKSEPHTDEHDDSPPSTHLGILISAPRSVLPFRCPLPNNSFKQDLPFTITTSSTSPTPTPIPASMDQDPPGLTSYSCSSISSHALIGQEQHIKLKFTRIPSDYSSPSTFEFLPELS